jgi:hypothetical protein
LLLPAPLLPTDFYYWLLEGIAAIMPTFCLLLSFWPIFTCCFC